MILPANLTSIAKSTDRTRGTEEQDVSLDTGDLRPVLLRLGATPPEADTITAALVPARGRPIEPGWALRILRRPNDPPLSEDPSSTKTIDRVVIYSEQGIEAAAARTDEGRFVAIDQLRPSGTPRETGRSGNIARVYESLYEAGARYALPRETINQLLRVFASEVDLQGPVGPADRVELVLAADTQGGVPELLYAALTVDGVTREALHFDAPESGLTKYLNPEGRSLRPLLLRKPIARGVLTSSFGLRSHPLLRYTKMHTGVDWSDRPGTPILAAGDGAVVKAEWDGGYGRRTEIQHTNGYVTAYSHQSRFARGLKRGARVRQGQVIGFVGSTGLSTGPHLHYELLVNGTFVDALKIRLPRTAELTAGEAADFARQRRQISGSAHAAGTKRWLTRGGSRWSPGIRRQKSRGSETWLLRYLNINGRIPGSVRLTSWDALALPS